MMMDTMDGTSFGWASVDDNDVSSPSGSSSWLSFFQVQDTGARDASYMPKSVLASRRQLDEMGRGGGCGLEALSKKKSAMAGQSGGQGKGAVKAEAEAGAETETWTTTFEKSPLTSPLFAAFNVRVGQVSVSDSTGFVLLFV